eukprot:scaffold1000_cov66-Skeletonema_marinoi.AAC.2
MCPPPRVDGKGSENDGIVVQWSTAGNVTASVQPQPGLGRRQNIPCSRATSQCSSLLGKLCTYPLHSPVTAESEIPRHLSTSGDGRGIRNGETDQGWKVSTAGKQRHDKSHWAGRGYRAAAETSLAGSESRAAGGALHKRKSQRTCWAGRGYRAAAETSLAGSESRAAGGALHHNKS